MGEKPREEILVSPEYSILEFGDGYIAMIQGGIEIEDEKGEKIVEFMIKPSDLLRKRYDIKDSALDVNGAMAYKIYKNDLIPLNQFDDANKKWLYIKTFKHTETEISKIEWNLRKRLAEMEKRMIILEGQLGYTTEQLQLAKTNPAEFLAQGQELYERMLPKMAELFKEKRDKE